MPTLTTRQRNLTGGVLLALAGAAAALRSLTNLHIGTPANMGPGFFPLVLGLCLAACGAALALAARADTDPGAAEERPEINLRAIGFVIIAVAVFALAVRPLGLVPAAFLLVLVAGFADRRSTPRLILPLAAGLALTSWLIFLVGLQMPLPAFAFAF